MKNLIKTVCLVLASIAMGACSQEENTITTTQTQTEAAAGSNQMAYVCPMKCEGSASMKPGKCPVCAMELEKNPEYTATPGSTSGQ